MIVHTNKTVGTTATALVTLDRKAVYTAVQINNRDSAAVYVGDATITAASGAAGGSALVAGGTMTVWLSGGDTLYGISAAGTSAGAVITLYSYTPADSEV